MGRSKKKERLGEINHNTFDNKMTIVKYTNASNITVEFESGYERKTTYTAFKEGRVKQPYDKVIEGVGYLGEGSYSFTQNGKPTLSYNYWRNLLYDCYSKEGNKKYNGMIVLSIWHNYQEFAKWFENNYYSIGNERIILFSGLPLKGNKLYGPNRCIFIPERVKTILKSSIENNLIYDETKGLYKVTYRNVKLGSYVLRKDALLVYKKAKEQHLLDLLTTYDNKLPPSVYNILISYEFELGYL